MLHNFLMQTKDKKLPLTFTYCTHLVVPFVTATNSDCYIMTMAILIYNNKTQS